MIMKELRFVTGVWFALLAMGTLVWPGQLACADEPGCCGNTPAATLVEEVSDSVLTPVAQAPAVPEDIYQLIVVLTSQPLPDQWVDAGCDVPIAATESAPATVVTIRVSANVVSVLFWDATGDTTRYGYGVRSEVTINPGNGGALTKSSGFKLVGETADQTQAMAGAVQLGATLAQNAVGMAGPYSTCVSTCLSLAHAKAWGILTSCAGFVGNAAFVAAGVCALACLLAGPGWIACVTACLTAAGFGAAVISATCLAAYIALMVVSIPLCTLGCIGV